MERAKKKRTVIRTAVTRISNELEELLRQDSQVGDIEDKLELLKIKEVTLRELDKEIESLTDDALLEQEIENASQYEDAISTIKSKVNRLLREAATRARIAETEQHNVVQQITSASLEAVDQNWRVKLPTIQLQKFDGQYSEWQSFFDQFSATIHKQENMSNVDKFSYLRSLLSGRAAEAITGIRLTNDNYSMALTLLQERFGNKDMIVNELISKILCLPIVKSTQNVRELRRLHDNLQVAVRGLETAGVQSTDLGILICPMVMKLLPEDFLLECHKKVRNGDLPTLLEFLKNEVENREKCQQTCNGFKGYNVNIDQHAKTGRTHPKEPLGKTTLAFLNTGTDRSSLCVFCDGSDHPSELCGRPMTTTDRLNLLKRQGRCFRCFGRGHMTRGCRNNRIRCSKCSRKHFDIMCSGETQPPESRSTQISLVTEPKYPANSKKDKIVLLQTVRALTPYQGEAIAVRGLLDGGSQRSFITHKLSRELKLPVVGEESLEIFAFGDVQPRRETRKKVQLTLWSRDGKKEFRFELLEVPVISMNTLRIPCGDFLNKIRAEGIELSDSPCDAQQRDDDYLHFLLGGDYYWEVITGNIKRYSDNLVAVESRFGWTLQGPLTTTIPTSVCTSVGVMKVSVIDRNAYQDLASFWEIEHLGILDDCKEMSQQESEVLKRFDSTVKLRDGRYEVCLPWEEEVSLSDNYLVAEKRLKQLQRKLQQDIFLYRQYDDLIREQVRDGVAELIDSCTPGEPVYYMPHRAVLRNEKDTSRLRIVFDASSHVKGEMSLNDALQTKPNLNPELLQTLLSFRGNETAFVADIEKAFLQISLSPGDRDATRFLWVKEIPQGNSSPEIITLRMSRVCFGAKCSPFLLAATLKQHFKKFKQQYPETVEILDRFTYVDDLISGQDDPLEAFERSKEARLILSEAGMNLRKWTTNSAMLRDRWKEEFRQEAIDDSPLRGVLGLVWNTYSDRISFCMDKVLAFLVNNDDTKRSVLQTVAQVFDPLGLLAPYVIRAKCLFQRMWERGLQWDDKLPEDLIGEWRDWCRELPSLHRLSFPRFYFSRAMRELDNVQLHVFCDACPLAYGAVAYLRSQDKAGTPTIRLVFSKARVAPLKRITLPRLELLGAVLAAKISVLITAALNTVTMTVFLWTDSLITKCWIQSASSRWRPFVANRVAEIQKLSDPLSWRHCPGAVNPADAVSRGMSVAALEDWKEGPLWLKEEENLWPGLRPKELTREQHTFFQKEEKRLQNERVVVSLLASDPLVEIKKWGSWIRLLRVTSWTLRFLHNARYPTNPKKGYLTTDEIHLAEAYWIRHAQEGAFRAEITRIDRKQPLEKTSKLWQLNPFLDRERLLRVGSRLEFAGLTEDRENPILLPQDHFSSDLIIMGAHARLFHAGVSEVMVEVRDRFWLLRARQVIKRVLRKCPVCARMRARPASEPIAPLPSDRLAKETPFQVSGVDFFGPLYVKERVGGANPSKAYVALFTCASTRALHLELVSDLSTKTFLMAFNRFVSRRGLPSVMYSDNALTFKRADKELKALWDITKKEEVANFLTQKGVIWKYNIEKAAWWGGFWERLVKSVKMPLRKVLGRALLSYEELSTVLIQVEAIVNSRPLTYLSDEPGNLEALTPAMILCGKRLVSLPSGRTKIDVVPATTRTDVIRRYQYRERLTEQFWKRWVHEYLLQLRSAHFTKPQPSSGLQKNDVVLVEDDKLPRTKWKLAVVEDIYPGRDGKVRACRVKIAGGGYLRRPVQMLYPLELSPGDEPIAHRSGV